MAKRSSLDQDRWLSSAKWLLIWVIPPWNILCWVIALEVWALRATLGLAMQEDFARRVLRAPIDLPKRILRTLRLWRRRVMGSDDQRVADCAVRVLSIELKAKNFIVLEDRVTVDGYVRLRTIVAPDREGDYGAIVASVYRRFPELTLDRLIERTDPLEALDASWGAVHGMPDHARLAYTAPCHACKKNHEIGHVFGIGAVDRLYDESMKQSRLYVSQDGQRYVINGHYCDECRTQAGLVLIVGVSTTDHELDLPTDEKDN